MEILRALFDVVVAMVKTLGEILPFTSQFGIVKYVCEQGAIFGIAWFDKALFWAANAIATGVVALIAAKTKLKANEKSGLSILVYCTVLSIFASKVFWYVVLGVIGVAVLGISTHFIVKHYWVRKIRY